jgi:hypothetical protein
MGKAELKQGKEGISVDLTQHNYFVNIWYLLVTMMFPLLHLWL